MHSAHRYLCDEMLTGLGRWLRAAGYDTLILDAGEVDAVVLKRARDERRLLLTRDRGILKQAGAEGSVLLLGCNSLADCAAELSQRLHVDWTYRPFTRCLVCNTPLMMASERQRQDIPEDARQDERVFYCPACDKLYWEGGHVRRMRSRLQRWATADFWDDLSPP
ncbi:MAG: Mut7-C RNAse domain-containing protein [Gammaproteobacteria bacterium]|nr:Mut7-C RNAse domain-containing protein [Gammaproteobacteria bacterium]